jgi:hypothetical protein
MITLPEQLELEYMLVQRRLSRGDGKLDKLRLRARLHQIAQGVAQQKVKEVSALFEKKVQPPSQETINRWVDAEMESTLDYFESLPKDDGRQDAEGDLMEIIRKSLRGQREARASSALLSLNTELIEEVSRGSGSSHYRWETMKDSRVREWHARLQSKIQEWDDPPMGGGTREGDEGHPGSGFGCRCWPVPIAGVVASKPPRRRKSAVAAAATKKAKKAPVKSAEIDTGYKGRLKPNMTVSEAEDAIRDYKTEHGMVWGPDGKSLARIKGAKNSVAIPKSVRDKIQPLSVFTHNHPNKMPILSGGDVRFAIFHNLHEVRCVTSTRGGMRIKVTNMRKWAETRQRYSSASLKQRIVSEINDVERAATISAQDAVTEALGQVDVKTVSRDVLSKADEIFVQTKKTEVLDGFNRLGKKYGFRAETF